jgi:anhydro-N-acetylmuramic acid kinase
MTNLFIGLMSGTSADGVDAALLETDGITVHKQARPAFTYLEYPEDVGRKIIEFKSSLYPYRGFHESSGDTDPYSSIRWFLKLEEEITQYHALAVSKLLREFGLERHEIKAIGFHGQTLWHSPKERITWQVGNGQLLAELTGIDVVYDFRRRDVAAGGQGAPLVPAYHAALSLGLPTPAAWINIGGLANVTWVGGSTSNANDIIACDTGPGNCLLDDWVRLHAGEPCDRDGKYSISGKVQESILDAMLSDSYFEKPAPKSLDRNYFSLDMLKDLSIEDGAATLAAFTALSILKTLETMPAKPEIVILCGGGSRNPVIVDMLKNSAFQIKLSEEMGFNADSIEAEAFAFLAARTLQGLPISYPTTTGSTHAVTGGVFCRA